MYQRKLTQRLAGFLGHYMNDTKWWKLFECLSMEALGVSSVKIISIWDDGEDRLNELTPQQLRNPVETFHRHGIRDILIGGPMAFREIRKIVVYAKNLDKLLEDIGKLGVFEQEKCERG